MIFKNGKFDSLTTKSVFTLAIGFLLVNVILQCLFFKEYFLTKAGNADETNYYLLIKNNSGISLKFISSSIAQPFTFLALIFNSVFQDARFTNRFVSLLAGIGLLLFLFFYYKKNKFIDFFPNNKRLNNLIVFTVLFSVMFILSMQYVGTSDMLSVAFSLPAFLLLTDVLTKNKKYQPWLIGLLFALSFTSRPTFLVVLFAYLVCILLFYTKKIISKQLISVGLFFILFTGIINFYPLKEERKLVLDVKEIPASEKTSWFEMNYLMAKKWDSGEIPNNQWLSAEDVRQFKKENPTFIYPKNIFDVIVNDSGMFFRQMIRMFTVSMYSSFRYMYFLFPFLIAYPFIRKENNEASALKLVYFTLAFYFISLLLFMVTALKLMEFRWMYVAIGFYVLYGMDVMKNLSQNKRVLLFNLVFLTGIGFFLLKIVKDFL